MIAKQFPAGKLSGNRKVTCVKIELGVSRTSSAGISRLWLLLSTRFTVTAEADSPAFKVRFVARTVTLVFRSAPRFHQLAMLRTWKGSLTNNMASKAGSWFDANPDVSKINWGGT